MGFVLWLKILLLTNKRPPKVPTVKKYCNKRWEIMHEHKALNNNLTLKGGQWSRSNFKFLRFFRKSNPLIKKIGLAIAKNSQSRW